MARIIGYVRVSTEDQAENGYGLDAQRQSLDVGAARLGLPVALVESDEGISGAAPIDKRLGLVRALDALQTGDVLLVPKRDRLARGDVLLTAWIEKEVARRGARVVSVAGEGTDDDSPSNVLMRRIIDAFAEYERLVIKARTMAALNAKRAAGEALGNTPFGWRRGEAGRLEVDHAEMGTLNIILALWRSRPRPTYAKIVRRLQAAGRPARQMGWTRASVRRALAGRVLDSRVQELDQALAELPDGQRWREVARRLNDEGYAAPATQWSRGQVRDLIRRYAASHEASDSLNVEGREVTVAAH